MKFNISGQNHLTWNRKKDDHHSIYNSLLEQKNTMILNRKNGLPRQFIGQVNKITNFQLYHNIAQKPI